jgi:hypothetical protein
MKTEVYINGNLIDLEDEEVVVATYGNITFGEFNKRKGVQTNKWKAPFSLKNKSIFDNSEVIGSNSELPYRKATIEVKIDGVSVFYGFAVLEESQDNYSIQSYARASDFYSIINNKKLTELDLSEYNHIWSEANILPSLFNTKGYIYAFVYNGHSGAGGSIADQVGIDSLIPHMFFHTLIKQIAIDAGYTLVGDVLTNRRFLNHLVICNKFPLPIQFSEEFIMASTLPELNQSKLWLDFANIYGLQFDIDQESGIIRANYIDDIIFNEHEDWTHKVDKSEKPTITYSLEYGQTSSFRFNSDDDCDDDYVKNVTIDDLTLDLEVDIYKSPFFLIQNIGASSLFSCLGDSKTFVLKDNQNFRGQWISTENYTPLVFDSVYNNGTYYKSILSATNQEPPNSTYWTPIKQSDIWTTKSRPMYGYLVTDPSSIVEVLFSDGPHQITKLVCNSELDWENSYDLHYKVFDRVIKKTKKVQQLIKLNYSDINQIDFTKAKKIDNELYIVEDIRQFKLNRNDSTYVNLIRL